MSQCCLSLSHHPDVTLSQLGIIKVCRDSTVHMYRTSRTYTRPVKVTSAVTVHVLYCIVHIDQLLTLAVRCGPSTLTVT